MKGVILLSIVQGDHGYIVPFTVKKPQIENLEGATVEVFKINKTKGSVE